MTTLTQRVAKRIFGLSLKDDPVTIQMLIDGDEIVMTLVNDDLNRQVRVSASRLAYALSGQSGNVVVQSKGQSVTVDTDSESDLYDYVLSIVPLAGGRPKMRPIASMELCETMDSKVKVTIRLETGGVFRHIISDDHLLSRLHQA